MILQSDLQVTRGDKPCRTSYACTARQVLVKADAWRHPASLLRQGLLYLPGVAILSYVAQHCASSTVVVNEMLLPTLSSLSWLS